MCGRMSLFKPSKEIGVRFGVEPGRDYTPRYNIAPQQRLDVVTDLDVDEMDRFQWGLRPHWVDDPDDWGHPINARAETVDSKPSFRAAFAERRCLVVADGFYEWQGESGKKRPYRVHRADDDLFAFAGLWESWGENGDELQTVTIITTEPNDTMEPIHDRMPVMLEPDDEARWLEEDDPAELKAMLDPYPDELTDAYEISTKVNSPSNDSPDIIEPLGHGQSGLGQFG